MIKDLVHVHTFEDSEFMFSVFHDPDTDRFLKIIYDLSIDGGVVTENVSAIICDREDMIEDSDIWEYELPKQG